MCKKLFSPPFLYFVQDQKPHKQRASIKNMNNIEHSNMMDVLRNSGSLVGPRRLSYTCGRTRCCNPPLTPSSSTIRAIFKYPRLFSSRGTYRIAHWGVGSEVYRLLRKRKNVHRYGIKTINVWQPKWENIINWEVFNSPPGTWLAAPHLPSARRPGCGRLLFYDLLKIW